MLGNLLNFDEVAVLDYFAGSGAFGFESISRGAKAATFVEKDAELCRFIGKVAGELECFDRVKVLGMDRLPTFALPFELIFCDPPYELWSESILDEIIRSGATTTDTLLVCESALQTTLQPAANLSLELVKDKKYGDSRVQIFRCR